MFTAADSTEKARVGEGYERLSYVAAYHHLCLRGVPRSDGSTLYESGTGQVDRSVYCTIHQIIARSASFASGSSHSHAR